MINWWRLRSWPGIPSCWAASFTRSFCHGPTGRIRCFARLLLRLHNMQIAVLIALPTVLPSERAARQPAARITCTPPRLGAPPPNFVVVGRVGPVRNGKYLCVPMCAETPYYERGGRKEWAFWIYAGSRGCFCHKKCVEYWKNVTLDTVCAIVH